MSAEIIQLGVVAKERRKDKADQREREEAYRNGGVLTPAEFGAAYEAAPPEEKMRIAAMMGLLPAAADLPDPEPDPFYDEIARVQTARPDLGWSAAVTVVHDIRKGRVTFKEVAAGVPLSEDMLQPVFALQDAWKAAEAVFQEAIRDIARRTGRSPKSIAAVVHHMRKGHRVNSPT